MHLWEGGRCPLPGSWWMTTPSGQRWKWEGRGQARAGGLCGHSLAKLKFFFFFDTLKIGILTYQRSHVPFSRMIKAVTCPSQLHFMTPTFPSSIQRRLIPIRPKWRMSDRRVCQKVNSSVGQTTINYNTWKLRCIFIIRDQFSFTKDTCLLVGKDIRQHGHIGPVAPHTCRACWSSSFTCTLYQTHWFICCRSSAAIIPPLVYLSLLICIILLAIEGPLSSRSPALQGIK